MTSGRIRFDDFLLDPANRRLERDGAPVDLNARYLDALALLAGNAGTLITKDRFMAEVWRGVPVTDEALTQCIKTLRRVLGDEAGNPRLIETVPKHGYRFIGLVDRDRPADEGAAAAAGPVRRALLLTAAGVVGAGIAGLLVGLLYGFAGASQPLGPGMGAASVLLVLVCLTIVAALIAGLGISAGIAAAELALNRRWPWPMIAGAAGGLIVGAFAKLLGIDAFNLLLGRSPGDITGALEGALLGGAVGTAAWLTRTRSSIDAIVAGGAAGTGAGIVIPLLGGRMMGGSLDLLARSFPGSRLRLDQLGAVFGEAEFGRIAQIVTGGIEGLVFGACVIGAMTIARRQIDGG